MRNTSARKQDGTERKPHLRDPDWTIGGGHGAGVRPEPSGMGNNVGGGGGTGSTSVPRNACAWAMLSASDPEGVVEPVAEPPVERAGEQLGPG